MAWTVSHGCRPLGGVLAITKRVSSTAKIDPLLAEPNAVAWMSSTGRPANQTDVNLRRTEADAHIAAPIQVAHRRAQERIVLEDGRMSAV